MTNEGILPENKHLTIIPSGIKRHQHDINCEDAGCEEVINMRYQDGSWRTVGDKATEWEYDFGCHKIHIHSLDDRTNTIGVNFSNGRVYLINHDTQSLTTIFTFPDHPNEDFYSFSSLKSVLIVTTHYGGELYNEYLFRWDGDTEAYVELERNICPDIELDSQAMSMDTSGVNITNAEDGVLTQSELFDKIIIEKYKQRQKGRFCQSWIVVQWAFRLWDGSYIRHSNPVLKYLGTSSPKFYKKVTGAAEEQKYFCELATFIPGFRIILDSSVQTSLQQYKGLITDLCVFISQDVSNILLQYVETPYDTTSDPDYHYYKFTENTESLDQLLKLHPYYLAKEIPLNEVLESTPSDTYSINLNEATNKVNYDGNGGNVDEVEKIPVRHNTYSWKRLGLNWKNTIAGGVFGGIGQAITDAAKNWNKSWYTYEDAPDEITKETTDDSQSFAIQSQPELPVDDFSHHQILCGSVPYVFNSRLHKGDVSVKFGGGHNLSLYKRVLGTPTFGDSNFDFYIEVTLETDQGTRYVVEPWTPWVFDVGSGSYEVDIPNIISYPDARATRLRIIVKRDGDAEYYEGGDFALQSHKIYNFAYAITNQVEGTETSSSITYRGYNGETIAIKTYASGTMGLDACDGSSADAVATDDRFYVDHNRMQVSRAMNALSYPSINSYQFGNSDVSVLCFGSQATPISEGQFGQFPLVVFTSHGIFLVGQGGGEVLYSAVIPLNKEVAFRNSICELGGAIVFATAEGVKILMGNKVQHISRELEGDQSDKLYSESNYYTFLNDATGHLVNLYGYISEENFLDYLDENVGICYDKTKKEIIVSNFDLFDDTGRVSDLPYSYVYSLQFKTWHKITDAWHQFVLINSVSFGAKNYRTGRTTGLGLYDMTSEVAVLKDCLIQSRPMKWGTYDFKKPKTVVQRSLCHVGDPLDSSQDENDKFGLYMFASMENDTYKFVKGIHVSQPAGHIQYPSLPGLHASVRHAVLMTAVKSKDFVFSHWEVLMQVTMPGNLGAQARANTLSVMGDYNPDDYHSDYNIYADLL